MKPISVALDKGKETKGTYRFDSPGEATGSRDLPAPRDWRSVLIGGWNVGVKRA